MSKNKSKLDFKGGKRMKEKISIYLRLKNSNLNEYLITFFI